MIAYNNSKGKYSIPKPYELSELRQAIFNLKVKIDLRGDRL
jgi:hypothetical protein